MFPSHDRLGGKPSDVPEEIRLQMRAYLSGQLQWFDGDKVHLVSATVKDILDDMNIPAEELAEYSVPKPAKSARPSWLRPRAGIQIPRAVTEANRKLISTRKVLGKEGPIYLEVFMPDSTIYSGCRHLAGMATAYVQLLEYMTGVVPSDSPH